MKLIRKIITYLKLYLSNKKKYIVWREDGYVCVDYKIKKHIVVHEEDSFVFVIVSGRERMVHKSWCFDTKKDAKNFVKYLKKYGCDC